MRKIIFSMIVLMLIVLTLGPYVMGMWFQKSYRQFISVYNAQEKIHFTLVDYHRGWFSSDVTLNVELNPTYILTIKQHIQHGPIIYHDYSLGFAAIENKIIISPEITSVLVNFADLTNIKIESKSFISLTGNYYNQLKLLGLSVSDSEHKINADIHSIAINFWILPGQKRFDAEAVLSHAVLQNEDGTFDFDLKVSLNKLMLPALYELVYAVEDYLHNGEIYQGQLQQKISKQLPRIIDENSVIKLDDLTITSGSGSMEVFGSAVWPNNAAASSDDLRDLLMATEAKVDLKIPEKLILNFIKIASTFPDFVQDVAQPQRKSLIDARDQMEFAEHRNEIFIDYLSYNGYISKQAEDALTDAQKNWISLSDYIKTVHDLFLDRQIPLVVSYQLCWQYALMIKPYEFLNNKVEEFQGIAEKQIKEKFKQLLDQGYVGENDGNYFANIKWSSSAFTSNGREVK